MWRGEGDEAYVEGEVHLVVRGATADAGDLMNGEEKRFSQHAWDVGGRRGAYPVELLSVLVYGLDGEDVVEEEGGLVGRHLGSEVTFERLARGFLGVGVLSAVLAGSRRELKLIREGGCF